MSGNLSLSITARADRCVIHYDHGGESYISTGGGHGQSVVGASCSELGPLGRGVALEWSGMAEALGLTLGVADLSGKA